MTKEQFETLTRIDENIKFLKVNHQKLENEHGKLDVRQRKLEQKWWMILSAILAWVGSAIKSIAG